MESNDLTECQASVNEPNQLDLINAVQIRSFQALEVVYKEEFKNSNEYRTLR